MTPIEAERLLQTLKREVYPEIFASLYSSIRSLHEQLIEAKADEQIITRELCQYASCKAFEHTMALTISLMTEPPSPPSESPTTIFRIK